MVRSIAVSIALIFLVIQAFADTDITPDAVTRATTLNTSIGDVSVLTDRRTPDSDPDASPFQWRSLGLLVVEWPESIYLATIRIYIGDMDRYAVYGYLGGYFTETGQRVDVETPSYTREGLVPVDAVGWYDIPCSSDILIDNIGIQISGGATLYEIQLLGPDGTAIRATTFGVLKKALSE
jgi:hypothetical protein